MLLANYHTHTPRCMHATGEEEDYVRQAIQCGYQILGFADHSPWPYQSDFVSGMRMRIDQLDDYLNVIAGLKEKYADQIEIHVGLECEAFPEFYPWMRGLKAEGKVEYFILGNHYAYSDEYNDGFYFGICSKPEQIYSYMESTIAGMGSGLYSYLAHPDLFLHRYPSFDGDARFVCQELAKEAKRLNLPLEYNLLGVRRWDKDHANGHVGYTSDVFWEIAAEIGGRAIVGVDAHTPEQLNCLELYAQAYEKLRAWGFEVLDKLEL